MKNAALPPTFRPVGSVPSSRSRRAVSISVFEFDIEHRLGVGLVAGLRVVAGEQEQVANAECGGAHHLALQRDAVFVAAGDLQDRLDARANEQARRGQRAHMRARPGAVGDIDRIGEALDPRGLLQKFGGVAGHRRRQFGGHDETALTQAVLQGAGEAGAVLVHRGHSAYMLYRITANRL